MNNLANPFETVAHLLLELSFRVGRNTSKHVPLAAGNLWELRHGLASFANLDLEGIDNYGWQRNSQDTYDLLDFVICNNCKAIVDVRNAPYPHYLPIIGFCKGCCNKRHSQNSIAYDAWRSADYHNTMLYQSYSQAIRKQYRRLLHLRGLKTHEQK